MAGKPNKTQMTEQSVDDFLAEVEPEAKRRDCQALAALMARVTGEPAKMWGPAIVGFGVRHYRYDSGREGEICKVGFSPRKAAITLYVTPYTTDSPLVGRLGKITTGKGCIYVKRLADIDLGVLEEIVADTVRT
jgi:hypothetical protein